MTICFSVGVLHPLWICLLFLQTVCGSLLTGLNDSETITIRSKFKRESEVCNVCWCNKHGTLSCRENNTLKQLPSVNSDSHRHSIVEIVIENQAFLKVLDEKQLAPYPNLTKLVIKNSGLEQIESNVFRNNKRLREINFKNNQLRILPWKTFQGLNLSEILLNGNPFYCNCSSKWIQMQMFKAKPILGPPWKSIVCTSTGEFEDLRPLRDVDIPGCESPTVEILPNPASINAGSSVTLTCFSGGSPKPNVKWLLSNLQSRVSLPKRDNFTKEANETGFTMEPGLVEESITIHNVDLEDYGYLTCYSENIVGTAYATALLEVKSPPHVDYLIVQKKYEWCINYRITGVPVPSRMWSFNGKPVEENGNIVDLEYVTPRKPSYYSEGCLEFKNPTIQDEGLYTLTVVNSLGMSNRSIEAHFQRNLLPQPHPTMFLKPGLRPPIIMPSEIDLQSSVGREENNEDHFPGKRKPLALLSFLLCLIILTGIGFAIYKRRTRRNSSETDTTEKIRLKLPKLVENMNYFGDNEEFCLQHELRIISKEKISFLQTLGEGAFGRVFLGTIDYLTPDEPTTLVAIKTLKDMTEETEKDFRREAELLACLQHDNIVKFYGISKDGNTLLMVFEYMEHGDLNKYLRANDPNGIGDSGSKGSNKVKLEFVDLIKIAYQISLGMQYLSQHHFVHRDLATRNCLVGEGNVVKIADFGMSRDVYATDYYKVGHQAALPIRWMAPESILYRKFTLETDIWSYGVVLWEIFTFGKQPFYELSNHEVIEYITNNKILEKPNDCPQEIYDVMKICWKYTPSDRATFSEIVELMDDILLRAADYTSVVKEF